MAAVSYQFLTNSVLGGLIAAFGAPAPSTLAAPVSRAIITVMLFLAYELGYWIDHYLKHRIPVLWSCTKFTTPRRCSLRSPPSACTVRYLDFGNILAGTAALTNGAAAYPVRRHDVINTLSPATTSSWWCSSTSPPLAAHAHVDLVPRRARPHLHQPGAPPVAPLANPIHFNKNSAAASPSGDWLFGTLHIPGKRRENLAFGVALAYADAHTITGEFLAPIGRALATIAALFATKRSSLAAEGGQN